MKTHIKVLSPVLIFAASLTLLIACWGDGVLGVNGSVYEWVNPPSDAVSKTYIININDIEKSKAELGKILNGISGDVSLIPSKDAAITLGLKRDVQRLGEKGYVFKVIPDGDGNFKEGWTIAPTRRIFQVKISKPGYMEVIGEFENGGGTFGHGILAILVKNKS